MIIEEGSLLEILALTKCSYYGSMPAKILEEACRRKMWRIMHPDTRLL